LFFEGDLTAVRSAWRVSSSSSFNSSCSISRETFALLAEHHPLELGDDQLQMFDLVVAAEQLFLMRT
jgi:hypothetical protein